jgi:2-polyprenyl-3-methyl-5-hydroxy-6-metoxy-1,4-benzoquinol methylase
MQFQESYSFIRYLAAKKSVDDRALNRYVWDSLVNALAQRSSSEPLRILEIGAGIGTMIERAYAWNLVDGPVIYTAIDAIEENIIEAEQRLTGFQANSGWQLHLETIDLFDFLKREHGTRTWDVVIANAFLDLIDIQAWLPAILALAIPGGWFYFTINFDGLTAIEPAIEPAYDAVILDLYHQTMDTRLIDGNPSGDSCAGRHLFQYLRDAQADILAAGSSDWVVYPKASAYAADEAYFLHFLIHTIDSALHAHPMIDPVRFEEWVKQRHAQIDQHDLIYIAHQMDFFGSVR